MTPDTTALRERLELMAKVFDTGSSGSLYSRTIREASAALLSSAEAREEAASQRDELLGLHSALQDEVLRAQAAEEAAETRAQQAEARVEELEKALNLARPFLPIQVRETRDYAELTFGEHQTQAMTMAPDDWAAFGRAARQALQQGEGK